MAAAPLTRCPSPSDQSTERPAALSHSAVDSVSGRVGRDRIEHPPTATTGSPGARAGLPILVLTALALVACQSSKDHDPGGEPGRIEETLRSQRIVETLPAGTLLELQRSELVSETTGAFSQGPDTRLVDAWMRELLAISAQFDVADPRAGSLSEDATVGDLPLAVVAVAIDSAAGVWTSRLERENEPPVPLALARATDDAGRPRELTQIVSLLAARTRIALGDDAARLAPMPTPLSCYSEDVDCVLATERALRLQRQGSVTTAALEFDNALRADPGCTRTLASQLALELEMDGDPDAVRRRSQRALQMLEARTGPTTQHRLARLFWLASVQMALRGSGGERAAREVDRKLLELADNDSASRPFDPHVRFTRALALNQLGRFDESVVILRQLDARWPKQAHVAYHLCFAELAVGRPEEALLAIRSAARGLPAGADVLPRAIALYESGRLDELSSWLGRLAKRASADTAGRALHDVRRMQASLAILRGAPGEAAGFLLSDLEWMRARPSRLVQLAAELAEDGEVLILLGYAEDLEEPLAALQDLQVDSPAVGNAMIYLAALMRIATDKTRPDAALRELEQRGANGWHSVVLSAWARAQGDVGEEAAQLAGAVQVLDTPLMRARLARALRGIGRTEQANALLAEMRTEVARIDLRAPLDHPLFQPGLALAVLAQTSRSANGAGGDGGTR